MEELVIDPLEEELNEIEDLDDIRTEIQEGLAVIEIEAAMISISMEKYDEIVSQVNSVKSELPEGLYSLEVSQFSPFDVVILQLALSSENASYGELEEWRNGSKTDWKKPREYEALKLKDILKRRYVLR